MAHTLLKLITALAFIAPAAPALAQEVDQTSLDYHRGKFKEYSPVNFDLGGPISHYVHMNFHSFYKHATIARTRNTRPLERDLRGDVAAFQASIKSGQINLEAYVKANKQVDGMIILHRGKIVYEAYPRMESWDRHLSWSVSKVFASTALAALERQGKVNMATPVENYVPDLKGTAWAGTSLRDVANMASGINCLDSEGYQNVQACIYKLEESIDLLQRKNPKISTIDHLASMTRHRPAGTKNEYASADTFVIGMVIENITGTPFWIALQDLLWGPMGAESDGLITVSANGVAMFHGGLSLRLRDVARFGQIFTPSGKLDTVGDDHLADLRSEKGIVLAKDNLMYMSSIFGDDLPTHAAWQWDMIWQDGVMSKGGYSGQGILVDPERDLVIAWFGTDGLDFKGHEILEIARQLTQSSLFD